MPQFFIERPVFAWVVAAFIVLFGVIAIPQLPIARFPAIAPPSVSIYANYTGASAQTVSEGVVIPIERQLTGLNNLLYFASNADGSGMATITAHFAPGTNIDLAMVDVQNRLKAVEPLLPQAVRQTGLTVEAAASGFLMIVTLTSDDGRYSGLDLSDYMARNIIGELQRVPGVGRVQNFGTEKAMRIWVDPLKLEAFNMGLSDVTEAIRGQNIQIAPGQLGSAPTLEGQRVSVPLSVQGQLSTPEEFGEIIIRAETHGGAVLLKDVARVELGAQTHMFSMLQNGQEATGAAIQMEPGGNAVATAEAIKARLAELQATMPEGMEFATPFDTSPFVKVSIEKVVLTLAEAMGLVFIVMFLFLQNIRYTLIPAIVAPIALLGTFAVMLATGYSINVLTMFGMILAIGIIVDDAIVVVENVERIMETERLSPKEATKKAMKEITGAIIGITAVLVAVFIPMGLASGSVGAIYRQFTMSMAVSILFSAVLALSLTPALCATLLKPADHTKKKWAPLRWFNTGVDKTTSSYGNVVGWMIRRGFRCLVLYAAIVGALAYLFPQIPSSFLPEEDQGNYMASVSLPADATQDRTEAVIDVFQNHVAGREATEDNLVIVGFSFFGQGPNAAMAFVTLKDWKERPDLPAVAEVAAATEAMAGIAEGSAMVLMPPAIEELGSTSGFTFALLDRSNSGETALMEAQNQLLGAAAQSDKFAMVYPNGLPSGPTVELQIDRKKAQALGVPFSTISDTLTSAISSSYINDFPNQGRLQQVIVQADAEYRMQIDDILNLFVRNDKGGMVALGEVVTAIWNSSPRQLVRHNGFAAANIGGEAAPGVASGDAMAEIERIVSELPAGFDIEWTGQSLQEVEAGSQITVLLALSLLVVFLVLAALYESWTLPFSVMLVVPLGIIGSVLAVLWAGMSNDVFFKVGLITVIGLSAKNAILIVEFAKAKFDEGWALDVAVIEACKLRIRPIVMTSLAFALGVVPLVIASGASSETQRALGTGVFGGITSATVLALFFVPVFYKSIMAIFSRRRVKANAENPMGATE